MKVSVVICTWNRAAYLDRTLQSMHTLHVPEGTTWEILVINNNSTDHTESVLNQHENGLPLRRCVESKQGLSFARNRALDEAAGDLLLWTDDDVIVSDSWLASYIDAAKRWPRVDVFGGPVEPWFESDPPMWAVEQGSHLRGMLMRFDYAPNERELGPQELVVGANMAFRKAALHGYRFSTALGLHGDDRIGGEEWELQRRLIARGAVRVWVPRVRVRHLIPASRLTRAFLWKYYTGVGREAVVRKRAARKRASRKRRSLGAPRKWIWEKWSNLLRAALLMMRRDTRWVPALRRAAQCNGMILQLRIMSAPSSRGK